MWVLVSVGSVVINSATRLAEHLRSRQGIGKSRILCQFGSALWVRPGIALSTVHKNHLKTEYVTAIFPGYLIHFTAAVTFQKKGTKYVTLSKGTNMNHLDTNTDN